METNNNDIFQLLKDVHSEIKTLEKMFADQRVEFAIITERVNANGRHILKNSGTISGLNQSIEKKITDIEIGMKKINDKSKLDWGELQKKIFLGAIMAGLLFAKSPALYIAHLLKH